MDSESKIKILRSAAVLAGVVQAWECYAALATYFIQPSIMMDEKILGWLWGGINVFASCVVFVFYVAIVASSVPLRVPQPLKNVALLTAVMIGLQYIQMIFRNVGQPLLRPTLLRPTAWAVFTILFLATASRLPRVARMVRPTVKGRVSFVAVAALLACAAAAAELMGTLYMDIRFFRLLTVPLLLQMAIDGLFVLFFVLIYKAEPSHIQPDVELMP